VKPLRISPSSFDLFFKCSQQYKWAVIDEILPEEGSDNLYAVLGSSFHKIMELHDRFSFNQKICPKILILMLLSKKDMSY
jgi:hypothetical protein